MILDKLVAVVMNNSIKKYYLNKGYEIPLYRNPILDIKIEDLSKCSNIKLNCVCDVCGKKKLIKHQAYNKYIENDGFYACNKCSDIKKKTTKLERYGMKIIIISKKEKKHV